MQVEAVRLIYCGYEDVLLLWSFVMFSKLYILFSKIIDLSDYDDDMTAADLLSP